MSLLDPENLARLLGAQPPDWPTASATRAATGVAYHSQNVSPGDVFFALRGASHHGIEHARAALDAGAAYVVSDTPHPRTLVVEDAFAALHTLGRAARAQITARVAAITGSTGKTTVKTMVAAALGSRHTPGNLNTTPALVAALVQAALQDLGEEHGAGALEGGGPLSPIVLEIGIDRIGEMAELVPLIRPDDALLTTIAEAHLSAFGDIETVAREKGALLTGSTGHRLAGFAAARRLSPELRSKTIGVRVSDTGAHVEPARDLAAVVDFELPPRASGLPARLRGLGHELELPWHGRAMAENAALALAYAVTSGVGVEAAAERIQGARLEKHRLHRKVVGEGAGRVVIIDDAYNSNPASAALALETLSAEDGPLVAFLGPMRELGSVSRQRHAELGAATRGLDMVVAVCEDAKPILEGNPQAEFAADLSEAAALLGAIPAGATVLFKASRSVGMEWLVEQLILARSGKSSGESTAHSSQQSPEASSSARSSTSQRGSLAEGPRS